MKKVIMVKTDDPEKSKFNLVVTGRVEKVVQITPASVYMEGVPGDVLTAAVRIIPSEKYMFSILGMSQKMDTTIKARLIEPEGVSEFWQVKVEAGSDKPDNLYDVLTLRTDSPYKPELTVRVYAVFHEKPEVKP